MLDDAGVRVAYASGQKIKETVTKKTRKDTKKLSVVYSIPSGGCMASYYGETARRLTKRIKLVAHQIGNDASERTRNLGKKSKPYI